MIERYRFTVGSIDGKERERSNGAFGYTNAQSYREEILGGGTCPDLYGAVLFKPW